MFEDKPSDNKPSDDKTEKDETATGVKTGDVSNVGLYLGLVVAAMAAVVAFFARKRSR